MYIIRSILTGTLIGCDSADKEEGLDTASVEIEIPQCPNDRYSAVLQVWNNDSDESNFVDTPPFCDAPFEIDLLEGGAFYSAGDCYFEGGSQTRTLSYAFQGQLDDAGDYIGEVTLLRQNGEQELAPFTASCTQTEGRCPR